MGRRRKVPISRNLEIHERMIRGESAEELAREYGVSGRRIRQVRDQVDCWNAQRLFAPGSGQKILARQILQLEMLYGEALHAWRQSCDDVMRVRLDDTGNVEWTETKTQCGNPTLLVACRAILADLRKLQGGEEPESTNAWETIRAAGKSRDQYAAEVAEGMHGSLKNFLEKLEQRMN